MTTRYRVEYALKTHRRDQFIEWIKGLLAVPFVLYSQPAGVFDRSHGPGVNSMSEEAHRRYAEIMRDVEAMIDDHITHQHDDHPLPSKLKLLVPTVGPFFTRLPLEAAFKFQDRKRFISSRRFVSPSFNDVRLVLNSAQIMAVTTYGVLKLATFDGDVTLYDDGQSLEPDSPVVPRMLDLLRKDVRVAIVTAAGYTTADRYHARLHGLLDAMAADPTLSPAQRSNLVVMGGEANYLFEFDAAAPHLLSPVPRRRWLTPEMAAWDDGDICALLDVAESALRDCVDTLALPATVMRKDRAVGIIPLVPAATSGGGGAAAAAAATSSIYIPPLARESLEETVLVVQKSVELSAAGRAGRVPFCAFNGGRDVFVDIGDKSWGVAVVQRWFGGGREASAAAEAALAAGQESPAMTVTPIRGDATLHVGDQFLSAGANDFRARVVGTTAWIASPAETVGLLDELADLMGKKLS
ncbi:hypothetical protein RB595_005028 [Gaeumannomyces hyphopodioides]